MEFYMKKLLIAILIMLLSSNAFCVIQQPTSRCDANTFSIMPWGGQMSEGPITDVDEYYRDVYDMGFNVTGFAGPDRLAAAKKYNLMTAVQYKPLSNTTIGDIKDPAKSSVEWATELKEKLGDNLSNVYQVYIIDEPALKDAKAVSAYANACKNIIGVRPYVNLYPNYSSALVGVDYKEYLDKFLTDCPVDYVSYDNYSLFQEIGLDEDRFYSNIEAIRDAAKRHNVIFVNIILSVGHFNYSDPNDYSIAVQAWSTLAYGGKGLSYFTIRTPLNTAYRYSAYDRIGNRTSVYYDIQRTNFAIHNIMPYYKDLTCINTFHMGNVPEGCLDFKSSKNLKKLDVIIHKKPKGTDPKPNILVGEFKGADGKDYVIIVNKDQKWNCWIQDIEFNKGKKITLIKDWNYENKEVPFGDKENKWIVPGHGLLLRCDN